MENCDLKAGNLEQLDLNAPLISTRRLCGLASGNDDQVQYRTRGAVLPSPGRGCRSVPFLWEAAPGVPKAADRARDCREAFQPPRPPPGRWRPPGDDGSGGGDSDPRRRRGADDSGDDGDVDNGSGGGDFSDSADLASLSDSLSVACSRLSRVDGGVLDVVCVEDGGELGGAPSPGFMMQRFLPAAAALAASFASDSPGKPPRPAPRPPRHLHHHPRKKMTIQAGLQLELARRPPTRSYSSSKACGITVFFPWGFKQAFCGFKSSVQSRASFDRRSRDSSRGAHDGDVARHSFQSQADADGGRGGGAGEARPARTWDTPGWGLRFLDCRGCEGVAVAERGCEAGGGGKGPGKAAWSLPPLRSPSEPWLAEALRSISVRERR